MLKSICIALHLCSTLSGHAYVIDGDTIIVEGIHIRLHGIDAEELDEPHGLEARRAMRAFAQGIVTCKVTGARSHDRYIGLCTNYLGDLATNMVIAGKALDCAHYSHGKYRRYEPDNIRSYLIQKPYC